LIALHRQAQSITASSTLLDYLQELLAASRRHAEIRVGLSPRAGLALLGAARAWALLSGRTHVLPEDIQALFVPLAAHRLLPARSASGDVLARQLLAEVAVD
jgi:MoxR-like ATPase